MSEKETDLREYFTDITIEVSNVEDLNREQVLDCIERRSAVAIRGLVDPQTIIEAKNQIKERFQLENDNPATGEAPEDLYRNHQKFSVNGGEFRDKAYPQCLRTYYNPLFADDIFGMRDAFRAAGQVRNLLMGVSLDFALSRIEDGFWTAARVHQYPPGGGFMTMHCEDYIPRIYEQYGFENGYFQPLIVMSRKGTDEDCDYETGGGYFCKGSEKIYFEAICELGDVLVYDTRVMHGVTEVDLKKPFRQTSVSGRYAGFVTLYRDFSAS